jgi:hypothetical protein
MNGGLNTSISARSQGRMVVDGIELSFLLMCKFSFVLRMCKVLLVWIVGENAPMLDFKFIF